MRVILLGFRYSGKSVIGKTIAKINGLKFIDLDDKIEEISGEKIDKIVAKKNGWEKFRELEIKAFNEVSNIDDIVISCGGGFAVNSQFCNSKKMTFGNLEKDLLNKTDAIKVLFEIDEQCLIRRIKTSEQRPNFNKNIDIIEENLNLSNARKNSYNSINFDVKIDTSYDNFANAVLNNSLFCVIGDPCWHSLSPKIHNSFNEKLCNDNNFVYTKFEIKKENFNKVQKILQLFNVKGASITSPFKQEIMKFLVKIDNDESKQIGAVNTVIFNKKLNGFVGYNTDWFGVVEAIKNNISEKELQNKRIAIFGSGGGAKSAVIGCLKYTKNIVMFNRHDEKNREFAVHNSIKSCKLNEFDSNNFDIIINATTVGLNSNKSILPKTKLNNHLVFDMVYSPLKTKLLQNAIDKKCNIIFGTEMLVNQAKKQFEMFCNTEINNEICNDILQQILPKDYKKCIVVIGKNLKEFLKNLRNASKYSDFVELRTDYIEDITKKEVKKIAEEVEKIRIQKQEKFNKFSNFETIFTCRLLRDGGFYNKSYVLHKSLIEYAISLNVFNFFDFDISSAKMFENLLKNKDKSWTSIISYHNFGKCLSYKNTQKLIDKMFYYGDIAKVAMVLQNAYDVSTMLSILEENNNKCKDIIFAPMSDKLSRILAWKNGSWTNFVCLNDKQKTAEGQLTFKEFEKLTCEFM